MKLTKFRPRTAIIAALALIGMFSLSACKATEQYQDAPSTGKNDSTPAEVYSMPDGFANWAEKCDHHGFRVFVIFHNDGSYGSMTAVADPTCK